MTTAPASVNYASVISRETVCIALAFDTLNDLEVKCGDVLNAYITAPVKEKIWTYLGPEHGDNEGKKAIIVRALYGLKPSGADFRTHICECMAALGYKPVHEAKREFHWRPGHLPECQAEESTDG